jgi:hypothetical protein
LVQSVLGEWMASAVEYRPYTLAASVGVGL